MAEADGLATALDSVQINGTESPDSEMDEYEREWGFPLEELYKLASAFYKEKEGKAVHLSYKDKLRLVAYTKQVTYGKYRSDVSPEVGFLDVVGNDRRQAWQALGDMSRESAMAEFMKQLNALCPIFKPYIQAHKTEKEEQERRREKEEEKQREEDERKKLMEEAQVRQEQEKQRQQQQEIQIRAALNQQTARQFRQYAEQQYPEDKAQQDTLIAQLQEQHYQQYMQQVYQQQLLHQQQQYQQLQAMAASAQHKQSTDSGDLTNQQLNQDSITPQIPTADATMDGHVNAVENNHDADEEDEDTDEQNDLPPIAAASMWNRKDIKEFKESIKKDPDSVIKVGSGETVTVRVPTHEDGTCLFWEFATDSYDLGFGVYFEWTIAPSNAVSVHVSESSDEEDLEEEEGETKGDIEKGSKKDNRPPTDEIIPVYRRDCHEEVYCGSHMYPGRGVYLLKFDNSYSLWRSKYLYYRVYYTR